MNWTTHFAFFDNIAKIIMLFYWQYDNARIKSTLLLKLLCYFFSNMVIKKNKFTLLLKFKAKII